MSETLLKDVCHYRHVTETKQGKIIQCCANDYLAVPMNTFKHNGLLYCGDHLLKVQGEERINLGFPREHIYP